MGGKFLRRTQSKFFLCRCIVHNSANCAIQPIKLGFYQTSYKWLMSIWVEEPRQEVGAHFGKKKLKTSLSPRSDWSSVRPSIWPRAQPSNQFWNFPSEILKKLRCLTKVINILSTLWNWKKVDIEMHLKQMKLNQVDVKSAPKWKLDRMQAAPIQGQCSTRVNINLSGGPSGLQVMTCKHIPF